MIAVVCVVCTGRIVSFRIAVCPRPADIPDRPHATFVPAARRVTQVRNRVPVSMHYVVAASRVS